MSINYGNEPSDTKTHIGFEISVQDVVSFSNTPDNWTRLNSIESIPLYTYTMNKGIKLEMVFDDIKRENGKIKAEIEFRTTPIDFNFVDKILGDNIRTAINAFPQKKEEWLPRRSIKGWTPTVQPFPDIETVRDFVYPKQIPQQATISIEISAFCKLKDYEQEFLYKHGKGAKNKQELIQKIAARMNNLSIDVSAGARGKEEHTVKTPLESIIAAIADPKLQTPQCVCEEVIPGNYSILKDEALTHLIDAIKGGTRSYPEKQGDPNGYRAISEKLKPPFKDSDSGELRLLIEHRANSPLVTALHNRLNKPGDPDDYFKEVKKAAEEMDKNRKRRAGYTPSLLPLCLNYQAHTQSIGWMDEAADGQTAGTAGKSLRLEALRIRLENAPELSGVEYHVFADGMGWLPWVTDNETSGTVGESRRIEAVQIRLLRVSDYTITYRVHIQEKGWLDWASDGQTAGLPGEGLRVEAVEIKIVPRN